MPDLLADVRSMLETSVDRWAAIARIDGALLARPPLAGEWSALQCLQHAVDTESAVFRARVQAILDGRPFPGFDPGSEGHVEQISRSAPELVADLAPVRAASLETLAGLSPADLDRTGQHVELGLVTMAELLSHWAAHDTMHIVQAERALMQAFIPGSGPWRALFADHDVDGAATS